MAVQKFQYKKLYDELSRWIIDDCSRKLFHEEPRKKIETHLVTATPFASGHELSKQSQWWLTEAIVSCPHDIERANTAYIRSIDWLICELVTELARSEQNPRVNLGSIVDPCMRLAMAIASESKDRALFLSDMISRGLAKDLFLADVDVPISLLVIGLDARWRGVSPPVLKHKLKSDHVYAEFLTCLDAKDSTALPDKLTAMCDLHLARSRNSTSRETYEFDDIDYRIYPAEVFAALKVCEALGIPLKGFSHPIIDTPLAQLGAPKQALIDPLLERVKLKLKIGIA